MCHFKNVLLIALIVTECFAANTKKESKSVLPLGLQFGMDKDSIAQIFKEKLMIGRPEVTPDGFYMFTLDRTISGVFRRYIFSLRSDLTGTKANSKRLYVLTIQYADSSDFVRTCQMLSGKYTFITFADYQVQGQITKKYLHYNEKGKFNIVIEETHTFNRIMGQAYTYSIKYRWLPGPKDADIHSPAYISGMNDLKIKYEEGLKKLNNQLQNENQYEKKRQEGDY